MGFIGFHGFHVMLNTAVIDREEFGYSKPSSVNQAWVLSSLSGFLDEFGKTQLG